MTNQRRGFSLIELLVCVAIVAVLAAMVAQPLLRALQTTHETAAVKNIQAIHTAQAHFFSVHRRFADSLEELARRELPATLRDGRHGGYVFRLESTASGYTLTAQPERPGKPSEASYYSDESLLVRESRSGAAGPDSAPLE